MRMNGVDRIDISSGTIFRVMLILLAFWFVYAVFDIVLMLFAALIVAAVMEPLARYLERFKVPRVLSVILFYVLMILILSAVVGMMIEPIATQFRQLAAVIPSVMNNLNGYVPLIPRIDQAELINSLQSSLLGISENVANIGANIFAGTRSIITGVVAFVFVFVVALYLVVERDALKKLAKLLTPAEHYLYVERVIERAQRNIGRWALGQVVMGLIMGLLVGSTMWLIGVPYALLLGVLAAVFEIIPSIGPFLAAVVGVLVALTQGWTMALFAFIAYVIIGQIENHILIPNVMKRAVGLPPLVTIVAVIIGARLLGLIGIILAVPVATVIGVVVSDVARGGESEELSG